MKNIYDFERHAPPKLTESMLKTKIERRRLRVQTVLIILAALLMQLIIVLTALLTANCAPVFSLFCGIYLVTSILGGGTVGIIYHRNGGSIQ